MNPMRNIKIEKLTINMGCGDDKDKLERSKTLLQRLTNRKVIISITKKRTTFGMTKKRPIGCKVTLRGKQAEEFLKKAIDANDKKLLGTIFDAQGNFSFGVKEHIDIPGVKYDPDIGILGMDVCVTLERPGFRVKRKRISSKIGKKHKIKPDEAKEWLVKNYGVELV
jgi:large subunit ribosomal protein L5